jgi:hypothetical protein
MEFGYVMKLQAASRLLPNEKCHVIHQIGDVGEVGVGGLAMHAHRLAVLYALDDARNPIGAARSPDIARSDKVQFLVGKAFR